MLFDAVNPAVFGIIIAVAIAWIPTDLWLSSKLDFPQGYGAPCITGGACMVDALLYSPLLLRHHTPYELAMFVCVWMLPLALVGIILVQSGFKLRRSDAPAEQVPVEIDAVSLDTPSIFALDEVAARRRKLAIIPGIAAGAALILFLVLRRML